jgi:hypothetical protein
MIPGLRELLAQLPDAAIPFASTQFPFPVSEVLTAAPPELARLREEAAKLEAEGAPAHHAAWVVLMAAEAIESAAPDRDQRFIGDGTFRGLVFTGIKWRAGWALVLGEDQEPYARAFDAAQFLVFTTRPGMEVGRFLGERETASVYFAQLLARYAMLYSDTEPGARYDLGHFLEDHGPGVLVVSGSMRPVESLLCLALMRLGMRAVVTAGFPWEIGDRTEVDTPEQAVAAAGQFENMRIRSQEDPGAVLPEYAHPAHAHEKFEPARRLGGTARSFLSLHGGSAEEGSEVAGEPEGDLVILVAVDDATVDAPAAAELEEAALHSLNLLSGVRVESAQPLTLALAEGAAPTGEQMAEVVRRGLRLEFPRLGPVHVAVIGQPDRLDLLAAQVAQERAQREAELQRFRDADLDRLFACEACAPFSREHVCLVQPLRAPMCGRGWREMLVGARYMTVSSGRPWRRRGRPENCCTEVLLGEASDPLRGEYPALNAFVTQATEGRMTRVFLHSVRDFPHSSCGCFAALAWWSEQLGGLCLMDRGFEGTAPDGSTWNLLANRAGGKQQPGITGVGPEYLRSPRFLQGDGGWAAVVWMTSKLQRDLVDDVPAVASIPTEL